MIVAIYTDGGVIGKNPSKLGGTWAWCGIDEQDQHVWSDSGVLKTQPNLKLVTNNHMEQIAIVKALEAMPDGWSGKLHSDSMIALRRVFRRARTRNLPPCIKRRAEEAVARLGKIEAVLLNGHPTKAQLACGIGHGGLPVSKWNCWCDAECNRRKNDQTIYR